MGEREIVAIICLVILFGVIAAGVWLLDLLSSEVQGDTPIGDSRIQGYTGGYGGIQGDTPPSAPAQQPVRTRRGARRGT